MPLLSFVAWGRQLASNSTDAAITLLNCFRRMHGFSAMLSEISAEAAGASARRSIPLLRLPDSMECELEGVLAEHGLKPREARRLGLELAERLNSLSHTPQRGGFGVITTKPLLASGGRLRGAELLAAREAFEGGELLSMDDRAVNAALGLPPPLRDDQKHAPQMEKLVPKYKTEAEVMAYVVVRLAPEYAVCQRVLNEAVRLLEAAEVLPGAAAVKWRPREGLVYGAGVGAAVVAVLESCVSPSLARLVALEPSSLRQMMGLRVVQAHRAKLQMLRREKEQYVQQQQQQRNQMRHDDSLDGDMAMLHRSKRQQKQGVTGPQVSWVHALPPLTKASAAQRRRYDLVIAPYQLTVLPTVEERQRLVRELWDRCGDVMILIEPGTPRGFAAIAEARELVLGREGRKRLQLEAAAASGGQRQDGRAVDPRVVNKLRGTGAHVVAPCPHDGACPMLATKRHWCHFSQPLLLPRFTQQVMVLAGHKAQGRGRALNVQDERFSYVILRRGPRPAFRAAVSRDFITEGVQGDGTKEHGLAASVVPSRLPPRVVMNQIILNRAASPTTAARYPYESSIVTTAATAAAESDPRIGRRAGLADEAGEQPAARRMPLFGSQRPWGGDSSDVGIMKPSMETSVDAEMQPGGIAASLKQEAEVRGGTQSGQDGVARSVDGSVNNHSRSEDTDLDMNLKAMDAPRAAGSGGCGPISSTFSHKYPAFGLGLVGRLNVLQDAGLDWASLGQNGGKVDEGNEEVEGTMASIGVGDGSARSPGLDAAVAEISMLALGGVPKVATEDEFPASRTGMSVEALVAPAAVTPAMQGGIPTSDAVSLAPELQLRSNDLGATGPDGLVPELHVFGVHQQAALLTRDDVSDEEYDTTERQLVERIYGLPVAHIWQANRLNSGRARPVTPSEDDELIGPAEATNEQEAKGKQQQQQQQREETEEDEAEDEGEQLECKATPARAAAVRAAEASSYGWGRLVRSPRLRGGHIILDMCVGPQHHYPDSLNGTANGAPGVRTAPLAAAEVSAAEYGTSVIADGEVSTSDATSTPTRPEGRLVQQVVAKSARHSWMGAPAYRLARRLSWGDCWPDWYIRSHNTREMAPRTAPAATSTD
ncbi:hypothetical protein VaNZ11_005511 [Volvox africanus]|uniref:Uncharacterized protein n=1 Tax=Volvox africanus TaxID=51714 RepID=A0ABQ5S0E2_9CHLO|nr:hypothetical protein VaNZ11_005511 [Volvox africanus]